MLAALIVTGVYVVCAKLGLTLAIVAQQVTVVWPPTGIALAAVVLFGYRIWPAIAVGAFIANITTSTPAITSLGIATGNTLEAIAAAYLLKRFVRFQPSLARFRDIFGLISAGAILSTTVSATIGVASLCATGIQPWDRFAALWNVWFLGDAMGDVIIAPLVLTMFSAEARRKISERSAGEFIALVVVLVAFVSFVFGRPGVTASTHNPADYALFPVLIWAALRFGTCGTAIGGFITATIAIWGTIHGRGPFAAGDTNQNLISLVLFMFVAIVTSLIIAVAETQRRLAERSSQQSEERYRSLVLASSQVVWSTNSVGDVVEDLPTWRKFTGQSTEEMMGRGWGRMLHPEDIGRVGEIWERSLATGTPHEVEFRVLSAEGSYRDVFGRAVPVFERDGRIREWVGTLTDVTARKRAEREMQEANRRKDEFLAMLAHELRNPLAPIRNAAHVLRMTGGAVSPAQLQWARDVIDRQIQHLTRLVDDLLDVSRITQGKVTLRKETADLATIVARAVETSRPLIDERRHHFTLSLPAESLLVEGDATRLSQVVSNLLNNAAKYTEEGGQITLTASRLENEAVLKVRDTGIGIPSEALPHIFDLFTQADRSLDRSQGGLGIGLTLVRSLVEMHGGRVQVSSSGPGHGSEFVVYLPALPPQQRSASGTKHGLHQTSSPASFRILVVDDNLDAAESLALILELSGHTVQMAHEGVTALEAAHSFQPQVILLDIGLPQMDGYEVARRLREQPDANKLFLIAVTGYGQDQDRERSKLAGFDRHLVKPIDPSALQSMLASLSTGTIAQ